MKPPSLTKTEAVLLAIWSCVAISCGMEMYGHVADVLLTVGGAGVCAALITPTTARDNHE